MKTVTPLGEAAMPVLARIQPVDLNAVKKVFIAAIRFATSIDHVFPPFGDELRTSAQEQVEYMILEDEDTPLVTADEEVKTEVKMGLLKLFVAFENCLGELSSMSVNSFENIEKKVLQSLIALDWMCNMLPKMDMMKAFVVHWLTSSNSILTIVQEDKFSSCLWGVKLKLIEVTGKVLDAVGYGNVILPSTTRVELLKTWLPFLRKIKPIFDSKSVEDQIFEYKLNDDTSQNIEHAIVSLVLALPSSNQADILKEWMNPEQGRYPDLTEVFEVWCYRTKAAKRRLMMDLNNSENIEVLP